MKIYVASSWRNPRQQDVVSALRADGHDVYDFRNPSPGDHGFGWRQCRPAGMAPREDGEDQIKDPRIFRDQILTHPVARAAFAKDMGALRSAEATVLVLPCGRSAHLELGWATGHGQRTIVLLDDPMSEPELMYLMNTLICTSLAEVLLALPALEVRSSLTRCGRYEFGDRNHPAKRCKLTDGHDGDCET
jgi:hypothetical protein